MTLSNYLLKASSPNTITLRVRISTSKFWRYINIQSIIVPLCFPLDAVGVKISRWDLAPFLDGFNNRLNSLNKTPTKRESRNFGGFCIYQHLSFLCLICFLSITTIIASSTRREKNNSTAERVCYK